MIFFPYKSFSMPDMAVDINGQAGPNKWGYDIHAFVLKISETNSQPYWDAYAGTCQLLEKGGVTTKSLLYGKNYM